MTISVPDQRVEHEFRVEAFNILNRVNYQSYVGNLRSENFGLVIAEALASGALLITQSDHATARASVDANRAFHLAQAGLMLFVADRAAVTLDFDAWLALAIGEPVRPLRINRGHVDEADVVLRMDNLSGEEKSIAFLLFFEAQSESGELGDYDYAKTNCDGTIPPKGTFTCKLALVFPAPPTRITLRVGEGMAGDVVTFTLAP